MSQTHSSAASLPNFQLIFNNALRVYENKTKNDLLAHPLASQLQACESPTSILLLLRQQIQDLHQSRSSDPRLTKWLDPTVNVLYALSSTLGSGVGLIFSPANVVFAGVGVLLLAARDVRASQETLIDIFERMENFFQRLEIYIEVAPTREMMDIIMKIMVEVLTILGTATKEIHQGRTKKFLKRLAGKTDIDAALKRLDKLTHEEARMATAEVLKATHNVDDRVRGVGDRVAVVDDRVASVDERVRAVDDKVAEVIDDGREAMKVMQQAANDVDQVKRNQLQENLRRWLSPPDPSTNHNIACRAHHKGSATWFFQGSIFNEWKSTGSLLWIHGKPGSGKSVLCSTVIRDIEALCDFGQASMGYFYFDFRDNRKQHWHDLVPSLLTQLSSRSGPCCDILARLYAAHGNGERQPGDEDLTECLKNMLTLSNRFPVFLVFDALDECPNDSGIPSHRGRILDLVKELIGLGQPNLRICVTSRPEIDIRGTLEPLTSRRVSLHDQSGQKKDIVDYVKSVVYSDSEPIMRRWRKEDKDFVIRMLSERADGMFRWVFCQLETLRHCLPSSIRRTIDELPESLDETYERVLKEIKKPNRDHAQRLLQCLVAAIRPLRVDELAEILAVDFDGEGIPTLKPSWRWEDQEQALLSSCSSLITIVETDDSRVVQFSHFSVKEFLTSPRLASSSSGELSRYHIALEPAHTALGQACLSILFQLDDDVEQSSIGNNSPLLEYATRHWVAHAQFENVSSHLGQAMEYLFDLDKPHFTAWLRFHDIDTKAQPAGSTFYMFTYTKSTAVPLYYAALCGFYDLATHLIVKDPEHVNARGGWYLSPLVAALAGEHFQTAELFHRNGADPNVRGFYNTIPLHSAILYGNLAVVRKLVEFGADVNARDHGSETPLLYQSRRSDSNVIRILLEHGADVNARSEYGSTALHKASGIGTLEVVRLLIEHGAEINAKDLSGRTPLSLASNSEPQVVKFLKEHGAE